MKIRFGVTALNQRMANARELSVCIDPAFYRNPQSPAPGMPQVVVGRVPRGVGVSSQPELEAMVARGEILDAFIVDRRSAQVRYDAFLAEAERLGTVRIE